MFSIDFELRIYAYQNLPRLYAYFLRPFIGDPNSEKLDIFKNLLADAEQRREESVEGASMTEPFKCHLFQASINYLGHQVSKEGIAPMTEYLEIVKTWPIPKTRNEIRIF